mgnify:CR=1 FL=1
MEVIPAINAADFSTVKERLKEIEKFSSWVHFDIADGIFTPHITWQNPQDLLSISSILKKEVHLMIQDPDGVVDSWLEAGIDRIIFQMETIKDFDKLFNLCHQKGVGVSISIAPETPISVIEPYVLKIDLIHILSVPPGKSGQEFDLSILAKIKTLRDQFPNIKIEVDGGINPETAKLTKEAGADIVVSGSYIFSGPMPEEAYNKLKWN